MRNSLKITIIVLVVFLVVREFSSFSFSFYKNYSKINSTTNSSFRSWEAGEVESIEKKSISFDESKYPTIIFYGLDKEKNQSLNLLKKERNCVEIYIKNDLHIDLTRYVPLIKPIDFYAKISYSWKYMLNINNTLTKIEGSGVINTTGSNTIYGICSGKQAERLIVQKITKNVKKTIVKDVKDKLKSISL